MVSKPTSARPVCSLRRSQIVDAHDVKGTNGDGQFVLVDYNHDFGGHGNKVPMRHDESPPVRKPECKRDEAVFEALLNLLCHNARIVIESADRSKSRRVHRPIGGATSHTHHGENVTSRRIWSDSALAGRSRIQSGVALRLPPHSISPRMVPSCAPRSGPSQGRLVNAAGAWWQLELRRFRTDAGRRPTPAPACPRHAGSNQAWQTGCAETPKAPAWPGRQRMPRARAWAINGTRALAR